MASVIVVVAADSAATLGFVDWMESNYSTTTFDYSSCFPMPSVDYYYYFACFKQPGY